MKTITKNVTIQITTSELIQGLTESLTDVVEDSKGELSFAHYSELFDALCLGKASEIRGAFRDGHLPMMSNELMEKIEDLGSQGIEADVEVHVRGKDSILIRSEDIRY